MSFRCCLALLLLLASSLRAQPDGTPRWAGAFVTGGYIVSSPALGSDGTLYVGTQDNHLYAIAPNGALKWRFQTGDWVDSTPAMGADGTIYFGSWDGKLYALRDEGTQPRKLWEFSTGAGNYIYSSPALAADGTIYFGAGDANFYALRPDGSLKWTYPAGDWIDSSPAIGTDGTIYYGSWDGNVYALRDDGGAAREVWRFATGAPVLTSPALTSDRGVLIGANNGRLYALDAVTGDKRWEFAVGGTLESSPAVGPDGSIYLGGSTGFLHALNADGSLRWKLTTLDPIASTPAVRADGTVIFGGGDSTIYALDASGVLRWKLRTGDWVDSSPVIARDGTVYIGSYDKRLYAFNGGGSPASAVSPWPMFRRDPTRGAQVPAAPVGGRLVNLSTRAEASAAAPLIAGFVVSGAGQKPLLVRAVGPTLAQFGVSGPLSDPTLQLRAGATLLAENNDWPLALVPRFATVGAFPLPAASRDAALLHTAVAGAYTAQVGSTSPQSGIALAEVYDAASEEPTLRLINLSTRAHVGVGENALTPGLVIGGSAPVRVLLRGVGPSLVLLGVQNVVPRPTLTLFSGLTSLATNAGWATNGNAADLRAAAQKVGAFPLIENSADSALLVTLAPGAYTVRLAGALDTTGEGLVEVYVVP
jgi:outer membrane protein assembly factor BamB